MKKYEIPVIKRITFEVDFNKVYNAIKKEYPNFDDDDIYIEFGNNMEDYLKEVCPKMKDVSFHVIREYCGVTTAEYIVDTIWTDFVKWIKENKK